MLEKDAEVQKLLKENNNDLQTEIEQMKRDFLLTENEENELLINSKSYQIKI